MYREIMFFVDKMRLPLFDLQRENEGGAMNIASGIFTTPVAGLYHFEFAGSKDRFVAGLWIDLQVNGANVGRAAVMPFDKAGYATISLTASLRLKANDRVNLVNRVDGALFDDNANHFHFVGWLVEEDLI